MKLITTITKIDTPGCKLTSLYHLYLLFYYKCLFRLNFDEGHVGIAEIW